MKTTIISIPILFIALLGTCVLNAIAQEHPRIYCSEEKKEAFLQSIAQTEWKSELISKKKANLEKYLELCAEDPEWLVSRLQMNWKTKHNKVYLKGGDFSHSEGTAPVPTVRFSGSRDWATDYATPKLEEVEPYFDEKRGLYLKNKTSKKKEWVHPSETGHIIETINRSVMSLVQDAALLYWITGEEKYAEFAEPVFLKYIEGMYYREPPLDLENGNQQGVSGLATFEVIHEQIVVYLTLTYDFLYQRFKENKVDLDKTVAVFQKWGDQIIQKGIPDNNWNLFQARFLTYLALALDQNDTYKNGKGQAYYLKHIFDLSTERQIALKESILVYDQENGIWPESASYSVHVTTTLLRILTLLDHSTNKNELSNFPIIEKAALAAFQYLFPSGYTVGFGDSNHKILPPENFELLISNYRKYHQKEKELILSGVLHNLIQEEKYSRKFRDLFPLFFYVDKLEVDKTKDETELYASLTTPTFYAPNVSLFIQRMGENRNATMVSTVASWGNHSHVNGISMELFANGYVLAPDMGKGPSYWHPDHREYYSQFPAHNTVVVDGISSYDRMRGYFPFTLENHYPPFGKSDILFKEVSFSNVSFVEPETMSDQQRLTALINSKSGKGYVVDIFRSKKKVSSEQKHEYFYHNIGQSLAILDYEGQPLKLSPTGELGTIHGDMKAYDYLSDKQSLTTSENFNALFTLESKGQADNLMKMWIKGSEDQEVFTVNSPKSNALSKGTAPAEVIGQKIPTLVLRKNEEAWNNPFVVVYNPHFSDGNRVISQVAFPEFSHESGSQLIEVAHDDGAGRDLFIANASENDIAKDKDLYMKGLLAIIRESQQEKDFIFVSGTYKFEYEGWEIVSTSSAATVSIERTDKGYTIQNDRPVLIRIPLSGTRVPGPLEIYENGKLIAKREGIISRHKADLMEYRLAKAYEKAMVICNDKKQVKAPEPFLPLPNQAQLNWHKAEYIMFIHFGMKTFYPSNDHMGYGKEDPTKFNPLKLDARQWVEAANAGGFKGIVFTTKHHDGFCNWQTQTTEHSVQSSPWKEGRGDVVKELAEACRDGGVYFGIYVSIIDKHFELDSDNYADYGSYYYKQLKELSTNYGPVDEYWFDGFKADELKMDYKKIAELIKETQPDAVVYESGTMVQYLPDRSLAWPGAHGGISPDQNYRVEINDTLRWYPSEPSIILQGNWFHNNTPVVSLEQIQDYYLSSVGYGVTPLMNISPNSAGLIDKNTVERLVEFKSWVDELHSKDLAQSDQAKVTSSSFRGNAKEFSPLNVNDGDYETYFATDDTVRSASIEIDLGSVREIEGFIIQEYIALGQRVDGYTIECWIDGTWKEVFSGKKIGYKRIVLEGRASAIGAEFPPSDRVRLKINNAMACPLINRFSIIGN